MQLLSIREYSRLSVAETCVEGACVSRSQAHALRALKNIHGYDIFTYSDENTLVSKQYVGTAQIGQLTIEVLPKIDGLNDTQIRRNLIQMLATCINLHISEGDVARVSTQSNGILEILIRLFCDKLFEQVHKGLVRRYESRSENLYVLRGKIGISDQIKTNIFNPEKLFCHFEEFQEDNPLNQVIKACLRLLTKFSQQASNQRKINELLFVFESVTDVPPSSLPWQKVRFDRMSLRYEPTYKLAELFLRDTPPDITGGGSRGFSLFFDMNKLFEEFVGRIAQRNFQQKGFKVFLQGPRQCLAMDEASAQNSFALKPDIVGTKDNSNAWIIDTKWKTLSTSALRDGVLQGDIYQMYAYSMRYKCSDVIILYPHHHELGDSPGCRASYRLNDQLMTHDAVRTSRIRIATLDLTDLSTVPFQLTNLIENKSTQEFPQLQMA